MRTRYDVSDVWSWDLENHLNNMADLGWILVVANFHAVPGQGMRANVIMEREEGEN